ncbi:MAG: Alcohol dehydrogenase GroES domain protein [Verrucomicrobiales bacterium]|nr:Alcohol dehydrogenase GroES domain protein [Verrucomicrobiales bacterium]
MRPARCLWCAGTRPPELSESASFLSSLTGSPDHRISIIPKPMKAALATKFGKPLIIGEVPTPEPAEGEVLIRIEACGVCHTDVHAVDGDWPVKPGLPFIPGHEGIGRVVSLGKGVKSIAVGDRVGVPWLLDACGLCDYCLTSRETLCGHARYGGYSANGGFAEFCTAPAAYVARIPQGLDPLHAGPIICAGVTTYKGLKVADCHPGEWVVISGAGGLGHLAIQYARVMGLQVAVVDVAEDKLALARSLGASLTVNASVDDPVKFMQDMIGGAHAVLVTAVSTDAFSQATGMLRRGGTCVLTGLPSGSFPISIFDTVLRCLTVRGSLVGTRADMREALAFAAAGKVRPAIEIMELEDVNTVMDRLRHGTLKGRAVLRIAHY